MRRLCLSFLFLFTLYPAAHAGPTPPPPKSGTAEDLESKTVALIAADDDTVRPYCGGVWVSRTHIASAAHCVRDMSLGDYVQYAIKADVFNPGSLEPKETFKVRTARIAALNGDEDLALLETEFPPAGHPVADLAPTPKTGTWAQHTGHMFGLWWSYSAGYVSGYRLMDEMVVIQSTTPILPGSSGCGLFDDRGRLLGIASRGKNPLNFFIPASEVSELLK